MRITYVSGVKNGVTMRLIYKHESYEIKDGNQWTNNKGLWYDDT